MLKLSKKFLSLLLIFSCFVFNENKAMEKPLLQTKKKVRFFIKGIEYAFEQNADGNTAVHHATINAIEKSNSRIVFKLIKKLCREKKDYRKCLSTQNNQGLTPVGLVNKMIKEKSKSMQKSTLRTLRELQKIFSFIEHNNDEAVFFKFVELDSIRI